MAGSDFRIWLRVIRWWSLLIRRSDQETAAQGDSPCWILLTNSPLTGQHSALWVVGNLTFHSCVYFLQTDNGTVTYRKRHTKAPSKRAYWNMGRDSKSRTGDLLITRQFPTYWAKSVLDRHRGLEPRTVNLEGWCSFPMSQWRIAALTKFKTVNWRLWVTISHHCS